MVRTRVLASKTLVEVEDLYRTGGISQDQYEAYMHVWATGAPRLSRLGWGWTDPPTDPKVAALVDELRSAR